MSRGEEEERTFKFSFEFFFMCVILFEAVNHTVGEGIHDSKINNFNVSLGS